MPKIKFIDEAFLKNLTGSLDKSVLGKNKKMLGIFELLNSNINDNKIDIKEITDFTNSIFQFDINNDGKIDKSELKMYTEDNKDTLDMYGITGRDILNFLSLFKSKSYKTDEKSQRVNNRDDSYTLIYEINDDNYTVPDFINNIEDENLKIIVNEHFDTNRNLTETEVHYKISSGIEIVRIFNSENKFVSEKQYNNELLVKEISNNNDIYEYSYSNNETKINKNGNLYQELITLTNGEQIIKEYFYSQDKTKITITTTNIDTNFVSTENIYTDSYCIEIPQSSLTTSIDKISEALFKQKSDNQNIHLYELNKLFSTALSKDNLKTFNKAGKDIIDILAKEDDKNFKQKYITGMINKAVEIAEICEIDAKELKDIQYKISEDGLEHLTIKEISDAYATIYKRIKHLDPVIEYNSRIKNEYYKGEFSYSLLITMDKVTIVNEDTKEKTTVNLKQLLKPFNEIEKYDFIKSLKKLPAEAILDLLIEVTFKDEKIISGADGGYNDNTDTISLKGGTFSPETILHELGHAIDCLADVLIYLDCFNRNVRVFQSEESKKFKQCFSEEMTNYLNAGNKRCIEHYNSKGEYKPINSNGKNYATMNEHEMFAECYCLLMYGSCNSKEIIIEYFPKTRKCVEEILLKTRTLSSNKRHEPS